MTDFLMPAMGADMESGTIVQWHVRPGDRVRRGDIVAVVETHKGAIDVECFLDGVVEELVPVGRQLPVGALLARVRTEGEAVTSAAAAAAPAPARAPAPAPASSPERDRRLHDDVLLARAPAPAPASSPEPLVRPATPSAAPPERRRLTPAARRQAAALNVEPAALVGTGADGAVTLGDVERPAARDAATRAEPARRGFDPAAMRQAIAVAMTRSKREIPHYYLAETVPMARAQAWLAECNAARPVGERLLPAVLLVKAVALALAETPELNGHYEGGALRPSAAVHAGIAISLRGGGLVAPALHDVASKPLASLMRELGDLVQRGRTGRLRSSEMSDATITITNLGDLGAEAVFGVIYPPQVALVGFGRVRECPWVEDGRVVAMPAVQASLAADHRVSDGHRGARFLAALVERLQQPETL